jgi:hypothetical protein
MTVCSAGRPSCADRLPGKLGDPSWTCDRFTGPPWASFRAAGSRTAVSHRAVGDRGEGPARDALRFGEPRRSDDPAQGSRWAGFAAVAQSCGFGSCLALPLRVDRHTATALNLYADQPDVFAGTSRRRPACNEGLLGHRTWRSAAPGGPSIPFDRLLACRRHADVEPRPSGHRTTFVRLGRWEGTRAGRG